MPTGAKASRSSSEIVFRVLPDRAAAASALEADEIQLAAFSQVPLSDLERISKVDGIKVYSEGYEALTYQLVVEINHRRKELADLKVRQAMAHAIDKDFVVKTIFLGYAKASTGIVPRDAKEFYTPDTEQYPFDVAKANALLDEAGYAKDANGVRFTLKLLPAPFFSETRQFGDYLRQALAAVGINAEIANNDAGAHLKAVYTDHDFDISVGSPVFRGDPAISTTILVRSGTPDGVFFSNQGGFADASLDALIDKANETVDVAARTRAVQGFPEAGVGATAAHQRRRMGLHHGRPHQRQERLQQSALGGLQLGRYRTGIVIGRGKPVPRLLTA